MSFSNTASSEEPARYLNNHIHRSKRQSVLAACEECRKRKIKCDARRPCSSCKSRGVECEYLAKENETQRQAAKRKYEELAETHDTLLDLYSLLMNSDEQTALQLFRRLRNKEDAAAVLEYYKSEMNNSHTQYLLDEPAQLTLEEQAKRCLLITLLQSTVSLEDIVEYASPINEPVGRSSLPPTEMYQPLRHRVIQLEYLSRLLAAEIPSEISSPNTLWHPPPLRVPASPWTRLTKDDEGISLLVSTFLTSLNDHFRWVEEDLFLEGMRSENIESSYCSPFLVHSICAFASQSTEWKLSFFIESDYLTRGEHFHREAQRLWQMEEGKPSLTNIQALHILSMDACIRGKDKVGLEYSKIALEMYDRVRSESQLPTDDSTSSQRLRRAHACLDWSTTYWHLFVLLTLSQRDGLEAFDLDALPQLDNILQHTEAQWTCYPTSHETITYDKDLQFVQVTKLARVMHDTFQVLFHQNRRMDSQQLRATVEGLIQKLEDWYDALPTKLRQVEGAPAPVYEMIGWYYSLVIVLHTKARNLVVGDFQREAIALRPITHTHTQEEKQHYDAIDGVVKAAQYACECANILRYHREHYGVKIIPPALFQTSIVSSFALLQAMQAVQTVGGVDKDRLAAMDLEGSFLECFRFLLASGMQHMITRAVVQMLCHTSDELHVPLPSLAGKMLTIAGQFAWSPTDLQHISSVYPNLAIWEQTGEKNGEMEHLLRKWSLNSVTSEESPKSDMSTS